MVIADIEWIDIKKAFPKTNDGRARAIYILLKERKPARANIIRGVYFRNGTEDIFSSVTDINTSKIKAWAYRE